MSMLAFADNSDVSLDPGNVLREGQSWIDERRVPVVALVVEVALGTAGLPRPGASRQNIPLIPHRNLFYLRAYKI